MTAYNNLYGNNYRQTKKQKIQSPCKGCDKEKKDSFGGIYCHVNCPEYIDFKEESKKIEDINRGISRAYNGDRFIRKFGR